MKCIFCKFENPAYANFCMNCGSPQNLKLCGKCGAMNDKNVVHCVSCKAEFQSFDKLLEESDGALKSIDLVSEAEALAQQATKFKQFIADLQIDASEISKAIKEEDAAEIALIEGLIDEEREVEAPSSVVNVISEKNKEVSVEAQLSRRWGYLSLAVLLILVCGITYYLHKS